MLAGPEDSAAISAYSVEDEIESLCHAYVKQQDQAEAPSIEAVLAKISAEHHGRLLAQLIPLDIERRSALGEEPSMQDYAERFPTHRERIEKLEFDALQTKTIQLDSSMPVLDRRHAVGQRLANYVLVKRVGGGTYGEVWQAIDAKLNRTVALKIPRPAFTHHLGVGSLQREGQAAAQLKHANIVGIYGIEQVDDLLLIVSEFIDGPSLKVWQKKNRPSHETIALLCAKLAEGLEHAHDRGVVHRDLKPSNVLMDASDEPYIADFGLAKNFSALDSATTDGEIMGTPAYMSPEQAQGKAAHVDGRADVFALGVMLYEMLTGELPFSGERVALLHAIIHEQPPRPRDVRKEIPRDLETICLKALEKEPARRYASAQEMAVDLRRYLRGDAIIARRPKLPERVWRYLKKHPARAIAVALSLVAILAAGAAVNLASINRELVGLRPVTFTTEPPGAQLAIAPLLDGSNNPDEDGVIFPSGRTPLTVDLPPGDYFVVAVLSDGRFHEVFRHVPEKNEVSPGAALPHQIWDFSPTGEILLREIVISSPDVREMATLGQFHLDRYEFTRAEFDRCKYAGRSFDHRSSPADGRYAKTMVDYDLALAVAEEVGKRLPWEHEYRATVGRAKRQLLLPSPDQHDDEDFGPVDASPELDRIADDRGGWIWGLRSNVAEWTATTVPFGERRPHVVCGGGDDGTVIAGTNQLPRDTDAILMLDRHDAEKGVGFRAARSVRPSFFPSN